MGARSPGHPVLRPFLPSNPSRNLYQGSRNQGKQKKDRVGPEVVHGIAELCHGSAV